MNLDRIHRLLGKNQVQEAAKALSLLLSTEEEISTEIFDLANQVVQKDLEVIQNSKTKATH